MTTLTTLKFNRCIVNEPPFLLKAEWVSGPLLETEGDLSGPLLINGQTPMPDPTGEFGYRVDIDHEAVKLARGWLDETVSPNGHDADIVARCLLAAHARIERLRALLDRATKLAHEATSELSDFGGEYEEEATEVVADIAEIRKEGGL